MDAALVYYYCAVNGVGGGEQAKRQRVTVRTKTTRDAPVPTMSVVCFDFQPLRDAILFYDIALTAPLTISAEERARRRTRVLACVDAMP